MKRETKEEIELSPECEKQYAKALLKRKLEEHENWINNAFKKIRLIETNMVDKKTIAYVVSAITLLILFLGLILKIKGT